MIIATLFAFLVQILNVLFSWTGTVTQLPLGMDSYLSLAVGYFQQLENLFPPFQTIFTAFMFWIGYKMIMLTLSLFKIYHHNHE